MRNEYHAIVKVGSKFYHRTFNLRTDAGLEDLEDLLEEQYIVLFASREDYEEEIETGDFRDTPIIED